MTEMAILYDTSLCTNCKGCQVACKVWNNLPSPIGTNENKFSGSLQNPADLNGNTRLIQTFQERDAGSRQKPVDWIFNRSFLPALAPRPLAPRCALLVPSRRTRTQDSSTSMTPSASLPLLRGRVPVRRAALPHRGHPRLR